MMPSPEFLEELKKLKALADVGLLYSKNEYDKERYQEVQQISLRLLNGLTGFSVEQLLKTFPAAINYPTAKVDVRGLVLSADKKILLVKESADGKWSLPGGWADVGYTPKEVIIKECKEETGLDVAPQRLLAVFDKRMHPHPPQPFYVYKMVFYCEALTSLIAKGFDVLDVQYFSVARLPELSEDRILKSQLEILYEKVLTANMETYCD